MNHYLYEIKDTTNDMIYVGMRSCKCDIEDDSYMGSGVRITNAIKQRGLDKFTKRIITTFETREELAESERLHVNVDFVKRKDTYNIAIGGEGGDTWIGQVDPSKAEKQRINSTIHNRTPEFRKIMSVRQTERQSNPEVRKSLSKRAKDNHIDVEYRNKYEDGIRNRVMPEGWIDNMRKVKQTESYKQLRSEIASNYPIFTCHVCGKEIKSKGNLTQHINSHARKGEI